MFDYEMVEEIIDEIVRNNSPRKIIVFGSMARHEAGDHSDLDLPVVMDTELKGAKRGVFLHTQLVGYMMPMDIFVLTPEEFETDKEDVRSFTSEIVRTWVVAYEAFSLKRTSVWRCEDGI